MDLRSFARMAALVVSMIAAPAVSAGTTPRPPALTWHVAATPVKTTRVWTQAVAPRPDGGSDLVFECWNYSGSRLGADKTLNELPEWLVVDLASGDCRRFRLPGYANTNYVIDNVLRAPNGRVFFSVMGMHVNVYDPATRKVEAVDLHAGADPGYQYLFSCVI